MSCRTHQPRWGHIPDRHGKPSLRIRFPVAICRSCPLHAQCTPVPAKVLLLRPDQQSFQALQEARVKHQNARALYAKRAGVEGTIAQAVRTCEIRRTRYIGQNKLKLQALLTATSMNMLRACHWVAEEKLAATPISSFAKLVASVQQAAAA
ncbi:MAG: transposase [Ktedonobacteraceae bacterium]